jgi:hypothetical protein
MMPLILIPLGIGAFLGGASVWKVTDTSKQLTTALMLAGVVYLAWANRETLLRLAK